MSAMTPNPDRKIEDVPSELLLCRDRAMGHIWDSVRWSDGPQHVSLSLDAKGNRIAARTYQTFRHSTCSRCGTKRKETFEQGPVWIEKISNSYDYPRDYRNVGLASNPDIKPSLALHTELFKRDQKRAKA